MPHQTHAANAALDERVDELIKAKVRILTGKYGLTSDDLQDLRQELQLHIYFKLRNKAYWKTIRVSERTVIDRILNNRIRDFLRACKRKRDQIVTSAEPLSGIQEEGGEKISPALSYTETRHRTSEEEARMEAAVKRVLGELSTLQRRAAELFKKNKSTSEVARILGIHRTALEREKKRMREHFGRRGLEDFL